MRVGQLLTSGQLGTVPARARVIEAAGFDIVYSDENRHDPFLPLAFVAEHTDRLELGTSIVVAFPRNPMQVANAAHDLHLLSGGRFTLGLGSQVRAHIEKRYGVAWSRPVDRMREYVQALHAIWRCWNEGDPLRFQGEFFRHTLMTPNFTPPPSPHGPPRVHLAAVGERMTALVGEVADGLSLHPFSTARYVQEVTLPALHRGLEKSGRDRSAITVCGRIFAITGWTEEQTAAAEDFARRRISFYGSTPAYRPVLDVHGWGALQEELNAMSKQGLWDDMARQITPEVLDAFAVRGTPQQLPGLIEARYGALFDEIQLGPPVSDEHAADLVAGLRAIRPVRSPAST
ncbi:MAG TPA: TIGR03617 family F420-dependent LLM class oxidoreductase [Sporichthyaceae bacterium]|nr:TIGR03617 family F420-dependent LLM class oxidoreductase [Sporichthyaceae bacterium]